MKKILSLLGTITLIGTSTTSLVACNTQCNEDELEQLKIENKINTTNQEIKDNLEWIAPQEKPFNEVDNKWYFVVWRGDKNDDWKIIKFNNNEVNIIIDNFKNYELEKYDLPLLGNDLYIKNKSGIRYESWKDDTKNNYFKAVYRWNLDTQEPNLIVNKDGVIQVS
ncbi:lipoprotein [Spiroplasma citri]|uniref:Lipoprotein n=1 Tax=Spiroplasma citri TaxID=2133 RepID=A0AAX3SZM5_SPICI|nr:lipoprotein [Spiroplasma citri]WFG96804.1 lipoprotein [Spiroplasma citri]WFH00701.1 lipoprotein [Spiroplasma citri]